MSQNNLPNQLPDFAAKQSSADFKNDFAADFKSPSLPSSDKTLKIVISVIAGGVVLILLLGLLFSQVFFRSIEDQLKDSVSTPVDQIQPGNAPRVDEESIVPPSRDAQAPEIFITAPSTSCTYYAGIDFENPYINGQLQGGGLGTVVPNDWNVSWNSAGIANFKNGQGWGKHVENNWYSVILLGRVHWDEDADGAYPGTQKAAEALFQCYTTHSGVITYFGDTPEVRDYRSEAIRVDGHEAWIVQATYLTDESAGLTTTEASIVTTVVVETPNGPSVLFSDVAEEYTAHVQALENAIAKLTVIE